ncbi:sigma factor-like helix-turn-helix DNA-binding protein, partial [Streptomyces olivochromogenes]|uniref:sigma-70 region 4 domain-containing protein n=1 Tax=Streptomyces olivochromogenes TaxID=1963 RepID=UPI0036DD8150
MRRLPEQQREALRYFFDLPYDQIAQVMGAPPSSARAWASRARSKLARMYDKSGRDPAGAAAQMGRNTEARSGGAGHRGGAAASGGGHPGCAGLGMSTSMAGTPRRPGSSPGCCRSAWVREGAEPTDRVGDLFRPWPVAGESRAPLACGRDELGSGGEQPQPPAPAATGKSRSVASGSRQRDGGGA